MPLEQFGRLVERGGAFGALDVKRDPGGIEERGNFSRHAKRSVGFPDSEAGRRLAREKRNRWLRMKASTLEAAQTRRKMRCRKRGRRLSCSHETVLDRAGAWRSGFAAGGGRGVFADG